MSQGSPTASGAAGWETPGRCLGTAVGYGVQRGTPAPGQRGRADTAEPAPFPAPPSSRGSDQQLTARSFEPAGRSFQACPAPQPCPTVPAALGKFQLPSAVPGHHGSSQHSQPPLPQAPCKQCHLQQGHGATTTSPLASAARPAPLPSHRSSCLAGLVPNISEVSPCERAE